MVSYEIHAKDDVNGWQLVSQSSRLTDYERQEDRWAFNHILHHGEEYLRCGDTMWQVRKWNYEEEPS